MEEKTYTFEDYKKDVPAGAGEREYYAEGYRYVRYLKSLLGEGSDLRYYDERVAGVYNRLDRAESDDDVERILQEAELTPRQFVEVVALCRREGYHRYYPKSMRAAEKKEQELKKEYKSWRFIDEFLQNADDCEYPEETDPRVDISISSDKDGNGVPHIDIEFRYNEKGFSRESVWAICDVGGSVKLKTQEHENGVFYRERTGRKGMGFMSVFALKADNVIVHIQSNGFSFRLEPRIGINLPVWEEKDGGETGGTSIRVELINPQFRAGIDDQVSDNQAVDDQAVYNRFKKRLGIQDNTFLESVFLFLRRLKTVCVKWVRRQANGEAKVIEQFTTEYETVREKTGGKTVDVKEEYEPWVYSGIKSDGEYRKENFQELMLRCSIVSEQGDETEEKIHIVRYTRMTEVARKVAEGKTAVEAGKSYYNYSIAAPWPRPGDKKLKWDGGGTLYRTFPMPAHAIAGMPFAIDAPFILFDDRSRVEYSDDTVEEEPGEKKEIKALEHNQEVCNHLFGQAGADTGGVFASFLMWFRTLEGVRMEQYLPRRDAILFADELNNMEDGHWLLSPVPIGQLCRRLPLFLLFARETELKSLNEDSFGESGEAENARCFVSLDKATFLIEREKALYSWLCPDMLFTRLRGEAYRESLVAGRHTLDGLDGVKGASVVDGDFAARLNGYLDDVDQEYWPEQQTGPGRALYSFVDEKLYPFLEDNFPSVPPKLRRELKIFFTSQLTDRANGSRTLCVRREARGDNHWLYFDKKKTMLPVRSYGSYRLIESSPVELRKWRSLYGLLDPKPVETVFGGPNIKGAARKLDSWESALEFIEAAFLYHFDRNLMTLPSIPVLRDCALSRDFDDSFHPFRDAKDCINEYYKKMASAKRFTEIGRKDVERLERHFKSEKAAVAALWKLGLRKPDDFFDKTINDQGGRDLRFRPDTLVVLQNTQGYGRETLIRLLNSLEQKCRKAKENGARLSVGYTALKGCSPDVLAYFLNPNNEILEGGGYKNLCRAILNDKDLPGAGGGPAAVCELLLRAYDGAERTPSGRIEIGIDEVMNRRLETVIQRIAQRAEKNNRSFSIRIFPPDGWNEIDRGIISPQDETQDSLKDFHFYSVTGLADCVFLKDSCSNVYLQCREESCAEAMAVFQAFIQSEKDVPEEVKALRVARERQNEAAVPYINHAKQHASSVQLNWGTDDPTLFDQVNMFLRNQFKDFAGKDGGKKKIIAVLCAFCCQGNAVGTGHGNRALENGLLDEYRKAPWRFVYELIQNADDCEYEAGETPKLCIMVSRKRIIFEHNEKGFTPDNVCAITQFNDSSKKRQSGTTGRMGIGFKSVFALPKADEKGAGIVVHISSAGYSFKFASCLGSNIPIWEEDPEGDYAPTDRKGTRITIEGFDPRFLTQANKAWNKEPLVQKLEEMFSCSKDFFRLCPALFLRKLRHILVKIKKDEDWVEYSVELERQPAGAEEDFLQQLAFRLSSNDKKDVIFPAVRCRKELDEAELGRLKPLLAAEAETLDAKVLGTDLARFIKGDPTRLLPGRELSILAPLMTDGQTKDMPFTAGGLYQMQPLTAHELSIPLAVNAPFVFNPKKTQIRDAVEDSRLNGEIAGLLFDEGKLLWTFFAELYEKKTVDLARYIPDKDCGIFSAGYEKIVQTDLRGQIRSIPVLEPCTGTGLVSLDNAMALPDACYDWVMPDLLFRRFAENADISGKTRLVARKYAGLTEEGKLEKLELAESDCFADCLNQYLDDLEKPENRMNRDAWNDLLERIYSYLIKHYKALEDDVKKLKILAFQTPDGSCSLESAADGGVWLHEDELEEQCSVGQYRCFSTSSLPFMPKDLRAKLGLLSLKLRNSAFKESLKKAESDRDIKSVLEAILYYGYSDSDVDDLEGASPFLRSCVLEEYPDGSDNIYSEAYRALGRDDLDFLGCHLIKKSELQDVANTVNQYYADAGASKEIAWEDAAFLLQALGLKEPADFFDARNQLDKSILAVLEHYCDTRARADSVVGQINRTSSGRRIMIGYQEVRNCPACVFTSIFHTLGGSQDGLAGEYCDHFHPDYVIDNPEEAEAYLNALFLLGENHLEKEQKLMLRLSDAKRMGTLVQQCKLWNLDRLKLFLSDCPDDSYENQDNIGALDEDRDRYDFRTADLDGAFPDGEPRFLIFDCGDSRDDYDIVVLDSGSCDNAFLAFVKALYPGRNFTKDVERNNLRNGKWQDGQQTGYLEKLAKFRNPIHANLDMADVPVHRILQELLRNVNRHGRAGLTVEVDERTMKLTYPEDGFQFSDVYNISALGQQRDARRGAGRGFKTVFSLFERAEIYSNGFSFQFVVEEDAVRMERIISPGDMPGGETIMRFTVFDDRRKKLEELEERWTAFAGGDFRPEVLPVFLNNLSGIRVNDANYDLGEVRDSFLYVTVNAFSEYERLLTNSWSSMDTAHEKAETLLRQLKTGEKCRDLDDGRLKESLVLRLCIPVPGELTTYCGMGRVCSTMPTDESTRSSIWIDAPFELTPGQNTIRSDDSEYNSALWKLLFTPIKTGRYAYASVFTRALEKLDKDAFLPDYFVRFVQKKTDDGKTETMEQESTLGAFIDWIREKNGCPADGLKRTLRHARLFHTGKAVISLEGGYSVDQILYECAPDVPDGLNAWAKKNSKNCAEYTLIQPRGPGSGAINSYHALRDFAAVFSYTNEYFPARQTTDGDNMVIRFFEEEGHSPEPEKSRKLLSAMLWNVCSHSDAYPAEKVARMRIFPYQGKTETEFGPLKEDGVRWYYPAGKSAPGSPGTYRIFEPGGLSEKERTSFLEAFQEYISLLFDPETAFQEHALLNQAFRPGETQGIRCVVDTTGLKPLENWHMCRERLKEAAAPEKRDDVENDGIWPDKGGCVYLLERAENGVDAPYAAGWRYDSEAGKYARALLLKPSESLNQVLDALVCYFNEQHGLRIELVKWREEYGELTETIRRFLSTEVKGPSAGKAVKDDGRVPTPDEVARFWGELEKERKGICEAAGLPDGEDFLKEQYHGMCQLCWKPAGAEEDASLWTFRMASADNRLAKRHGANLLCLCPSCRGRIQYGGRDLSKVYQLAEKYAGGDRLGELFQEPAAQSRPGFLVFEVTAGGGEPVDMTFSWKHFVRLAYVLSPHDGEPA